MIRCFLFSFFASTVSFPMNFDHDLAAIDLANIRTITKRVVTNRTRTKSREIYCADLPTKQQLIAMKTTSGSGSVICCDLSISNGPCLNAVPVDDRYFALLKVRYGQMKTNSR